MTPMTGGGALLLVLATALATVGGELTPPYFNLAEGRRIQASATCGVDTEGPELYCKLVGANTENYSPNDTRRLIQGQVCNYCDPSNAELMHPAQYAIDGTSNWWQSPPLSRGMKYNEVNLTIDFGQEFHVAYLFIRMGNSPRPGLWTLEKSNDYGQTWTSWQHFSDSPSDCETYFGRDSLKPITRDDDVICTTEYSKIVPLEDGEIPVMLLNNRPSAKNYFNSTVLQEWTRATNVRFRFLRTKNLLGHLMSVARQDPTVTRRYFYSIRDISIGGRCMCNGHADTCDVLDTEPNRVLACQCQHHTCGIQCADCCPGFVQKKWRQNTKARPFQCEPCNCFDHSSTCVYDEQVDAKGLSLDIHNQYSGGGVCQNCKHNTKGINCNECKDRFYRPAGRHWNDTNVCQPCDCDKFYSTGNCEEETGRCQCGPAFAEPDCQSCSFGHFGFPECRPCVCNLNGTLGYHCEPTDGTCPCRENFGGPFCKECAPGYFGYPECKPCGCNELGSVSPTCDFESGQCECNRNFDGQTCDRCKDGYHNYPQCLYCDCDIQGTVDEVCSKTSGQCICKEGFGGPRCDQCLSGFFNYPNCQPCNCSTIGSSSTTCDATGRCPCLPSFAGKQCTQCSSGHYAYPECLACNCDAYGSVGISCNNDGQCSCLPNFDGKTCNQCKESFYNYPACEDCNCDPAGVIAKFAGCGSVPAGQLCQCKSRVSGRICNECKPLYWNLNLANPDGCEDCNCFQDGTIGNLDTCESRSGQCSCKTNVDGRQCDQCRDGSFDLYGSNLFGCKDCGCDIGGSISTVCNKVSGQCACHPRVAGRTCSAPLTMHYFPTLYQNQFEYEDGYTPSGAAVRYLYDEQQFPGFSKRGYAKFSELQNEVNNEISISKSSVYRMVIRYVNPTDDNVVASILITSDNPTEVDQYAKVLFRPTSEPQFVTVSGAKGDLLAPIVLDGGRYEISIKTDHFLYLDYFVLLPQAYYEGTRLTKKIINPCELGELGLCRHYTYPTIIEYIPSSQPFVRLGQTNDAPALYYTDDEHLQLIDEQRLPALNADQPSLTYVVNVPRPGPYIVIIDYVTDRQATEPSVVRVNVIGNTADESSFADDDESNNGTGTATLYTCTYTTVCRQPVIDLDSREQVFWLDPNNIRPLEIVAESGTLAAIKSIAIVPADEWSVDLITPSAVCVMQNGRCVQTTFLPVANSKKAEFESEHEDRITGTNPPQLFDNGTKLVYLDLNDPTIDIHTKLPAAGRYHVLLQYYQPNHHQFSIEYSLNDGPLASGKLPLKNCPSNGGCRVLIRPHDQTMWFEVEETVSLTFTNRLQKGVWLDYVLFVPVSDVEPPYAVVEKLLNEEPFDQTKEFIQQCGQNHFHIQLNASDFCKQAVFSLTSDYNHGALPCGCNYDGSNSFECDPFGGQCQCRENVIGRQCDACRTGFYGFPDCKPCDCPSTALCHKETGECICPPRVTGDKCDKCEDYTFGFDQIIGCELCNCSPDGVLDHQQCDLNNGSCECRQNVWGRQCDKCMTGHFNFPYCDQCRCNQAGTTYDVCNPQDETCYCKKNVRGTECNECAEDTYNLQASNPDGCTKCFCFGKSSRCDRAYLRTFNVSMIDRVSVNTFVDGRPNRWPLERADIAVNDTLLQLEFGQHPDTNGSLVYFGMIAHWRNQSHLMAYGGWLSYTLYYTTGLFGEALFGPDLLLEANGKLIAHTSYEQPANALPFHGRVQMLESQFTGVASGLPVTREQFMEHLRDLDAIYVRATYWQQTVLTRLADVQLTIADDDPDGYGEYTELPVERCDCPPGYDGYSCEKCAEGYYRDPNGPYGGYCKPCECNGHAGTCDCQTGVCDECAHHTTGDHCERCIVGYHGNATLGTPSDCMICACPLPVDSNNFATGCDISDDGSQIACQCEPGYTGARCQSCAAGFFGRPEVEGERCQPCNCSGNIDASDASACDSVTGECLQCLHNTAGQACNLCASGFYGDAVNAKNCQSCACDALGTDFCDSFVGECHCHDNVIGEKCDRCADNHYGFAFGRGCTECGCGVASLSTQCDDHSGECRCRPGVTGRQCDRCMRGFWNMTADGCSPCACNTDYALGSSCNVETGQCQCLPGVVGEKCDRCPDRWVLEPDVGCHECQVCQYMLLDSTDALRDDFDPVMRYFEQTTRGYYTAQRLVYLNESVNAIEPSVLELNPHLVNLAPLRKQIDGLEADVKGTNRRVQYAGQRGKDLVTVGLRLLNETNTMLATGLDVHHLAAETTGEIQQLADSFDTAETTKIDTAVNEADGILRTLREFPHPLDAGERLTAVDRHLDIARQQIEPVQQQDGQLLALRADIDAFGGKMTNLYDWSNESLRKSAETRALLERYVNATTNSKFEAVSGQEAETKANIERTMQNALSGNITIDEIGRWADKLRAHHDGIRDTNDRLDVLLPQKEQARLALDANIRSAAAKRDQLAVLADGLAAELLASAPDTETALKAATAYTDIVDAVSGAQQAVREAHWSANNATALCEGVGERAGKTEQVASQMLDSARDALNTVQADLQPRLNRSSSTVLQIVAENGESNASLDTVNRQLDAIGESKPKAQWQTANELAVQADRQATEALAIVRPIAAVLDRELADARELPKRVADTNVDLAQIISQVDRVNRNVPSLANLTDEIERRQQMTNMRLSELGAVSERLREQIEQARQLANSIKVGMEFLPSTQLELQVPKEIANQAARSNVQFYVRTDKPDGFLLYLGNENGTAGGRRNRRNDFLALEVQNGYPILTINADDGTPQRIVGGKPINDGVWHQVQVSHNGPDVTLAIGDDPQGSGDVERHETSGTLTGSTSIFNFDKDKTKLFVGGYPQHFGIQKGLKESSFEGQIENLRIGDDDVGLWNFVDAMDTKGAQERDRFLRSEQRSNGYRFNGHGYVILDSKPYQMRRKTSIRFVFKVGRDVSEGLIFYAGTQEKFISLELLNGGISFKYKLGKSGWYDYNTLDTQFNDDQWHKVEAERDGRSGVLRVDGRKFYTEYEPQSEPDDKVLQVSEYLYVGGHPDGTNHSALTTKRFEGCIRDVELNNVLVDLSHNQKMLHVRPGCPDKISTAVSFDGRPGYVRRPQLDVQSHFQVILKFRTVQPDGLLFYGTDDGQEATIGLALRNGSLVFSSRTQELTTENDRFNDGLVHTVTATHDAKRLHMVVDYLDDSSYESEFTPEPLNIALGQMYFGGLPPGFRTPKSVVASTAPFVGCLSDVTIGREQVNFANASDRSNALLDGCDASAEGLPVSHLNEIVDQDEQGAENGADDGYDSQRTDDDSEQRDRLQKAVAAAEAEAKRLADAQAESERLADAQAERERLQAEAEAAAAAAEERAKLERARDERRRENEQKRLDAERDRANELDATEAAPPAPPSERPRYQRPKSELPDEPKCKLPASPDLDVDFDAGYRFGTVLDSHVEYTQIASKIRKSYDVALKFRTNEPNGLLFYAADSRHTDYIALYMHDGYVHHEFNIGNSSVSIQSRYVYGNNEWHTVLFSRQQTHGKLIINGDDSEEGDAPATSRPSAVQAPFYFGGVHPDQRENMLLNLKRLTGPAGHQFGGCIKDMQIGGKDLGIPAALPGVIPCSSHVEAGVFFGPGDGYVKLRDRFKVGTSVNIELQIRPRTNNALLLSVYGKKAFLILELIDGSVQLTANDGDQPYKTTWRPNDEENLCDGEWHTIKVIKSNFIITLTVDSVSSNVGQGDAKRFDAHTSRPLFLGGHPHLMRARNLTVRKSFVGCMRNVRLNSDDVQEISNNMTVGQVQTGVCPIN